MDLQEADILDPNPDIHALFCYYNELYFGDSLRACSVTWSSKRMTLCAGVCCFLKGGGCEIRLSEPLLKLRSSDDLKNTLLHEMIHAYLWLHTKNQDHNDHGAHFQKLMRGINSSSVDDHQRPVGGYKITIYHSFHAEVDSYRVHHWMCQSCGDLVKRAMNREPSASDCTERVSHDRSCGNAYCHWHRHKEACSGSYKKISEPLGYGIKTKPRTGKRRPRPVNMEGPPHEPTKGALYSVAKSEGKKKILNIRPQLDTIDKFYPVLTKPSTLQSTNKGDIYAPADGSKVNEATEPSSAARKKLKTIEPSCTAMKKLSDCKIELENSKNCETDFTVISKWMGWYSYERQQDEECVEPLINKRMERRRKQRLLRNTEAQKENCVGLDNHDSKRIVAVRGDINVDQVCGGGIDGTSVMSFVEQEHEKDPPQVGIVEALRRKRACSSDKFVDVGVDVLEVSDSGSD
ncbi:sprT-like domain-containing protein Spartan isoform X1 [Amborella trichopoda]|uniref:SprT-like domain-containing protein n=2 Tax=Amborella trichopoda TaxID=13333 RepID=W1PMD9_AMBTC|nr:sprT-like domain-containing protein Spartan isoform X1 [Amborella trichopoda]XP_011624246.1 sprT-like domain-containing protein Spartan isoform X1 [Amborella trichopoda]ERN08325.1 hypothetical protein AMTR_s00156p00091480 [Amborella trichopoda]|eukprot:XP_006846650.1 sprT-like domain-containing protein Spartan isoform X1 [Amborella trichopoda]